MKFVFKNLAVAAFALGAAVALTSCNSDGDGALTNVQWSYSFEVTNSQDFTTEGYYDRCYDTELKSIQYAPNLAMSHSAQVDTYDGVEYKSWYGFCPSRSKDNADQGVSGDWIAHQWGSITGGGANGSLDYVLAYWDTREPLASAGEKVPEEPCCAMVFATAGTSNPQSVKITNSAYGYYAMLHGTDFNLPFSSTDWCKVIFYGVNDGQRVSKVEHYLAKDGKIANTWETVDLTPLGNVRAVYMQMESSQTSMWGMTNPSYFCLDDLKTAFQTY